MKAVEAVVDNLNPIGGVLKNIAEEIFTKKWENETKYWFYLSYFYEKYLSFS